MVRNEKARFKYKYLLDQVFGMFFLIFYYEIFYNTTLPRLLIFSLMVKINKIKYQHLFKFTIFRYCCKKQCCLRRIINRKENL